MSKIDGRRLSQEVKDRYTIEDNTFRREQKSNPRDRIEVEIGDSKQPGTFYPQAKIKRWDNEVNTSFRYVDPEPGEAVVRSQGNVIRYEKPKVEFHAYELDPSNLGEDGGLEIELLLKEKPDTNRFDFTIQTKGLNFYYQGELTPEEIEQGASRPENVMGSYAVYHTTKGGMNRVDGMEYKTGKAFHIYRPKVTDAEGKETWGELNVDEQAGILSVTVDQIWLDQAVYPAVVDPTFGLTSIGASSGGDGNNRALVGRANPGEDGTVTKITHYNGTHVGSHRVVKGVLWNGNGSAPFAVVTNGVGGTADENADGWWDLTYSISPTVTSQDYYVGIIQGSDFGAGDASYFDSGSAGEGGIETANSFSTPESIETFNTDGAIYSVYATYTVAAENAEVTPSAQTITISQPAPTISTIGNVNVTPAAQTVTASQPSPTISVVRNINVAASVQTVTASLPSPTITSDDNAATASIDSNSLTDLERDVLRQKTGLDVRSLSDLRLAFYRSQTGLESLSITDLERAFLQSETGSSSLSLTDLWRAFLVGRGVTERHSLNHMKRDFYQNIGL